jgi:hypothetical protein
MKGPSWVRGAGLNEKIRDQALGLERPRSVGEHDAQLTATQDS